MTDSLTIITLPIGELDMDQVCIEYRAILSVARSFTSNILNAEPVQDVASAKQACLQFSDRNPDLFVLIALRGRSAQTMEAAARTCGAPCLLWPIQGRFALPSSALAAGALHETGFPVEMLYAPPDHPSSIDRFRCVSRAAKAYSRLRQCRIGIIGGLFPNLVSCQYDLQKVRSQLGISILQISFEDIRNSLQSLTVTDEKSDNWFREVARLYAVPPENQNALDAGLRLHQALKGIAREKQIDGFVAECWTGFPRELGLNPCLGFLEDAYVLACEGDLMLCAALLIVQYLTGVHAYVGDLYDLDMDSVLTLVHCGGPASLASDKRGVVLEKSHTAMEQGFDTMTCRPRLNPGPVTLLRLYGLDCDQLHVASGYLLSSETTPDLSARIKLSGDRWSFLEHCFGNHYVVAPGDIRSELQLLCKWLGIKLFET